MSMPVDRISAADVVRAEVEALQRSLEQDIENLTEADIADIADGLRESTERFLNPNYQILDARDGYLASGQSLKKLDRALMRLRLCNGFLRRALAARFLGIHLLRGDLRVEAESLLRSIEFSVTGNER